MIYLIHFDKAYKHSKHYLGFHDGTIETLPVRLARHSAGNGARLLQVLKEAGISWQLVRVWPEGTRDEERKFKKHSSTRECPICNEKKKHLQCSPIH